MTPAELDTLMVQAAQRFDGFSVGVIIPNGRKILLLQRAPDDFLGGFFELPGGGVEQGERVFQTVIREVLEETGLEVTRLVGFVGEMEYEDGSGRRIRQFTVVVDVSNHEVRLSGEHTGFRWVSQEDIESAGMTPETLNLVRSYFRTV